MAPIINTPELFIFDTITHVAIIITSIILFIRTQQLYRLSLQKGIKYLSTAMFFFIISFAAKYTITILDFLRGGIYRSFDITPFGIVLNIISLYGAILGGFYLAYCLMWRKYETDKIPKIRAHRVIGFHIVALIIIVVDMYFILFKGIRTPFLFYSIVIFALVYAIYANCEVCKKDKRKCESNNPFLALVSLGLGVYIVFFIENLLDQVLFTIHYYAWGIATVLTLTFFYHVIKLIRFE